MKEKVKIHKIDELNIKIDASSSILSELSDNFSYFVPGYRFMSQFKYGDWDGKMSLFNAQNQSMYFGLLGQINKFCRKNDYEIEIVNKKDFALVKFDNEIDDFKKRLGELTQFNLTGKYQFQWDAVETCLKMNKLLVESPTSSGKSQIIYLIVRFLLQHTDNNILIIVPTISLTSQLLGDFKSYKNDDFDVDEHVSILHGTTELKNTRVLISTYQSLISKMKQEVKNFAYGDDLEEEPLHSMYEKFLNKGFLSDEELDEGIPLDPSSVHRGILGKFKNGALIVDECHLANGKGITKIIKELNGTKFRFGFTGTISDAKIHEMNLIGLFGPKYKTVTTNELMKIDVVSDLDIQVKIMQYDSVMNRDFHANCFNFIDESKWITRHFFRNEYITNLALGSDKNTLILFNFIEHGETLFKMINEHSEKSGKTAFLINGSTPAIDRELVRKQAEENDNVIIIASSALFSTGVNIKNLHSIIFAHSFKAKIRNLQSIGRGLRLNSNKTKVVVYDIADDLSLKKENFSLVHLEKRLKIYQDQKFDYTIQKVNLYEDKRNEK